MKILRSWLNDYVETKKYSDEELSDLLTFSGTLVEEVIKKLDDRVVVAKIEKIEKHPNADKLRLATVNNGSGILQIVCGAPNIEVGQTVPLAMLGAKLGDFEISKAVIRGVESCGMLCSGKELGLSEDHQGIMILPADYKLGESLNRYINSDSVFDIEITSNRGDCLSHLGIAREVAAASGKKVKFNNSACQLASLPACQLNIEILSPELCSQYHGAIIKGVKVKESPQWLQDRLIALGLKPINNIVDITNYIMLDLGQPLHAFDRKKVSFDTIVVRKAETNESITTIDGKVNNLSSGMLLIADPEKAIAIAGVMGGLNSEIDQNTTEIILESAEFDRRSIRKTSKLLNLSTDASYRYERAIDPEMTKIAFNKAIETILEISGGELVSVKENIAGTYQNNWIKIEYDKINKILGTDIAKSKIDEILVSLGFEIKGEMAQAPSFRHDIEIWQDLAEEVGRIYGLQNIEAKPITVSKVAHKSSYYFKEHIKDLLISKGFTEIFTYPFLSEKDLKEVGIDSSSLLEVANPTNSDNKFMRSSLKPGALRAIGKNPTFDPIQIFEVGNVFNIDSEKTHLLFAVSGKNARKLIDNTILILETELKIDKGILSVNEIGRDDMTRFKIKKAVTFLVEVEIDTLLSESKIDIDSLKLHIPTKKIHYRPISKFPSVVRDLAFIVSDDTSSEDIVDLIYKQSDLINRVELFDEFSSDKFGKGMKNIAFHIDMQHQTRTLTDTEANEVIDLIVREMRSNFKAELRNY